MRGGLLASLALIGGAAATVPGCAKFEKGWDLPGSDYKVSPANDTGCESDGHCPCQAECDAEPQCQAWVVVPGVKCCLKTSIPIPRQNSGSANFFSGVKAKYLPNCGTTPTPPPPIPTPPPTPHVGPLACMPNDFQPMLPTFHIIGNVTIHADGSLNLEAINDCSGVTYYKGIYHVWHQCCQNHWDHVISKDLIHWQRLPPPIQPLDERTFDGSFSILPEEDGGPIFLYDAPDKIPHGWPGCGECILSIARLNKSDDKYLQTFTRDPVGNPINIDYKGKAPVAFPSTIWKNDDHWNFLAKGSRFTTKDKSFLNWARADNDTWPGCGENGGQWWIPTPNQIGGAPPPAGTPNYVVNCGGGDSYRIGNYFPQNESFIWDGKLQKHLERGTTGWWGAQGGPANNNRMMMIGWVNDYRGEAGPGIKFLTRLSLLREVNWDVRTGNLVSNPVPELEGLRNQKLHQETVQLPVGSPHVITGTEGGAAASAEAIIQYTGFGTESVTFGACVLGNGSVGSGMGITITVNPVADGTHVANVKSGWCEVGAVQSGGDVMLFNDKELTLRAYADRSVADWFVQGGQWAATDGWGPGVRPARLPEDSSVMLWSSSSGITAQTTVWSLGCGWLNPSYTENPTL